jgi:hypothetical protein
VIRALSPEEDQRIWGPSAALLERLFKQDAFRLGRTGWWSRMSPIARHSPLMQVAAARALPILEDWIERGQMTQYCMHWVGLNAIARPARSAMDLIRRCPPIPGRRATYSFPIVFAFNTEAVARKDWPALRSFLEPLWPTWKSSSTSSKEGTVVGDSKLKITWRQFGPLVEAHLRLKDPARATTLVQEMVDRHGSRTLVRQATALATRCGAVDLALRWNALIPAKGPEAEAITVGW